MSNPKLTIEQRKKLRALTRDPKRGPHAQRVLTQFRKLAITPNDPDLIRAIKASVAELADMKGA